MNRAKYIANLFRVAAITLTIGLSACGAGSNSSTGNSGLVSTAAAAEVQPASGAPVSGEQGSSAAADKNVEPHRPMWWRFPYVMFSAPAYSTTQNAGSVALTVERVGSSVPAIAVEYSTVNGTAVAGTDFTTESGTLKWAENDSTPKTIQIPVSNAKAFSGSKAFSVALTNPTSDVRIARWDSARVTISGDASVEPGDVALSAATYAVAQGAGRLSVTVNRVGGASGSASVDYATANGTAVSGTDYTAANGTLAWADGDASPKTFSVAVSNAKPFSGGKSFTVSLSKAGGVAMGTPANAGVTINGDASPLVGSLQFSAAGDTVAQGAGTVTVTVSRINGSSGAVSASYATSSGTAVSGTDFTAATGTLSWAAGDTAPKSFSVAVSNAKAFAGNKAFTVVLSNPTEGATIGNPGSATVTISGDAAPAVGSLQFAAPSYAVTQSAGAITLTVDRAGGTSGAISVAYASKNGTAISGTDYTAVGGVLHWAAGDAAAKTFSVAVSNATPFSGSKSFSVSLSTPAGGASIGSPTSSAVTINGSAQAAIGSLQLSASSYPVGQAAGVVTITVDRTGGSSGAVNVGYATGNGTAVAGTDFTATSGTLSWAAGDAAAKTVSVAISNAAPFVGNRSFSFTLSGAAGGAALGTPTGAQVNIAGSGTVTGGSGPSAPTKLVLTGEGANSESLSWAAASAGSAPIAHYKIYRNGDAYATATGTTYTDSAATSASVTNFGAPANIYTYAVSAVDSSGNEGPKATQVTYWAYYNGTFSWPGTFSSTVDNFSDTAGAPEEGPFDVSVTASAVNSYTQPFSGPPSVPLYALDIGSFNYMTIDLKPTVANQTWRLDIISRVPPGDMYNNAYAFLPGKYGPAPVVGKWATYKIPLTDLAVGTNQFVGSIAGTTLTVTKVDSGISLQPTMWIRGAGIAANTYITSGPETGNGGVGTYTLNSSQSVPSTTISGQRTAMYKFYLEDTAGLSHNVYYMDNIGFTTE